MARKQPELVCQFKQRLLDRPVSEVLLVGPVGCSGSLKVEDPELANPKLARAAAQKQIKLSLTALARQLGAAVTATEAALAELYRQDLEVQNPDAFQDAGDVLGALAERLAALAAGGLAAELEGGVVKRLGLKPKQVSARVDLDAEPPSLLALFPSQNRLLPDRYLLRRAIRLKRWQHCGVVSKGKLAYLLVDRKKPVKKGQLKSLQKGMGMGGGVINRGYCCWQGGRLMLRFLAKASAAAPKRAQLKLGLARQLGLSVKPVVSCDLEQLPRNPKDLPPA